MGAGTITSRLGALLFAKSAGFEAQLIPYKGSAEIVQGVLSGSVDFALDSVGSSLPMVQSGQFRALAKYSRRPLPQLPDLPSLAEAAGLPDTRRELDLDRLDRAGRHAGRDRGQAARARSRASTPIRRCRSGWRRPGCSRSAARRPEFAAFIRSETERWSKVIKDNGGLQLE